MTPPHTGTLFAMALPDLYLYVMNQTSSSSQSWMTGAYGVWGPNPKTEQGLTEIYRYVTIVMTPDSIHLLIYYITDGSIKASYNHLPL